MDFIFIWWYENVNVCLKQWKWEFDLDIMYNTIMNGIRWCLIMDWPMANEKWTRGMDNYNKKRPETVQKESQFLKFCRFKQFRIEPRPLPPLLFIISWRSVLVGLASLLLLARRNSARISARASNTSSRFVGGGSENALNYSEWFKWCNQPSGEAEVLPFQTPEIVHEGTGPGQRVEGVLGPRPSLGICTISLSSLLRCKRWEVIFSTYLEQCF